MTMVKTRTTRTEELVEEIKKALLEVMEEVAGSQSKYSGLYYKSNWHPHASYKAIQILKACQEAGLVLVARDKGHYIYSRFSPKVTRTGWWEVACICGYRGSAKTEGMAELKVMGHMESCTAGFEEVEELVLP